MDNLPRKEYAVIGALATAGIVWTYMPVEYKLYLFPSMVDKSGDATPLNSGPLVAVEPVLPPASNPPYNPVPPAGPFGSTGW